MPSSFSLRDSLLRQIHSNTKSGSTSSSTDARIGKRKAAPTSPTLDDTAFDLFVPPGAPWMSVSDHQDAVIDAQSMLGLEVYNAVQFLKTDDIDKRRRELVVECLRRHIVGLLEGASVHIIGSSATPFVMAHNDLNLCIEYAVPHDIQEGKSQKQIANYYLKRVAQDLVNGEVPGKVLHYESLQLPFIKINRTCGLYDVTICFNQESDVKTATSLALLAGVSRFHTPMIMVVKQLLAEHGLDNASTGGLSTCAVAYLVWNYFQSHNEIRTGHLIPNPNLAASYGFFLIGFFRLYGRELNFDKVGISVAHGGSYFTPESRGWRVPRPGMGWKTALYLEDLHNPEYNIGSNVTKLAEIQQLFRAAEQRLVVALDVRNRATREAPDLTWGQHIEDLGPEGSSILHSIIGVKEERLALMKKINDTYPVEVFEAWLSAADKGSESVE